MFSQPSLGRKRLANFNFGEKVWLAFDMWVAEEKKNHWGGANIFPSECGDLGTGLASSVSPPELPDLMAWGHCHSTFSCQRSSADVQSAKAKASQAGALEKAADGGGDGDRMWVK